MASWLASKVQLKGAGLQWINAVTNAVIIRERCKGRVIRNLLSIYNLYLF